MTAACRNHAALGIARLVAIIDPTNVASQRVALKIGLSWDKTTLSHGQPFRIYAAPLPALGT